jgi:uncharacterized protein YkwD
MRGQSAFASGALPLPARLVGGILLACTPLLSTAGPQEDDLVTRINDYRDAPHTCEGKRIPPSGPLTPTAALSRLRISPGAPLHEALKANGYRAARVQVIAVTGSPNAGAAMRFIGQHYCSLLSSQQYAAIGVSRQGNNWQIVFAQPLLSEQLGDWRTAGKEVLKQVNAARAKPRSCGKQKFSTAAPLAWNQKLAEAALAHSRNMAKKNYFSHAAQDGDDVSDRATRAGYAWRRVGENIAAGQGSAEEVVSGWLASPGHCANIMKPEFTEMAAAFAVDADSDAAIYWTQVFGTPH